jgi:predicted transcriptional regulator
MSQVRPLQVVPFNADVAQLARAPAFQAGGCEIVARHPLHFIKVLMSHVGLKIKELHHKGLSYKQIVEELKCSKATVSYHLSEKSRNNIIAGNKKRKDKDPLIRKVDHFRAKRRDFQRIGSKSRRGGQREIKFTLKELRDKFGNNPTCYLTGRKIDLSIAEAYSLDHIIQRWGLFTK